MDDETRVKQRMKCEYGKVNKVFRMIIWKKKRREKWERDNNGSYIFVGKS